MSGQIKVTRDFVFKDGEEFDLEIRVTDSDHWGKTENTANFKLISRDDCKDIRTIYNKAVNFCPKNVSEVPSRAEGSCPRAQCLVPLYTWQEKLNVSEKLKVDCSFDPYNMAAVMQKYSPCIGKSFVLLGLQLFLVCFLYVIQTCEDVNRCFEHETSPSSLNFLFKLMNI